MKHVFYALFSGDHMASSKCSACQEVLIIDTTFLSEPGYAPIVRNPLSSQASVDNTNNTMKILTSNSQDRDLYKTIGEFGSVLFD